MARRSTVLLVALCTIASLLVASPAQANDHTLEPALAQAAAPGPTDPIRVPLGEVLVRGLIHHRQSDRIVVAADDRVLVFDLDGRQTATIEVTQAIAPVEAGALVVTGSPVANELVVIDPAAGSVVRRIDTGARGLSSIAVVGDRIWFVHDQWPDGVGVASISAGTASPDQDVGRVSIHDGAEIDAAALHQNRVYVTNPGLRPSNLFWGELGGTWLRAPAHESFRPFVLSRRGDVVWAMFGWTIVEFDAETMEETGFRFEEPLSGTHYRQSGLLVNHADTRLVVALGDIVTQYDVGRPEAAATTRFAGHVRAVDVSDTQLFAVVSDSDETTRPPASPSELVIMDRDGPAPAAILTLSFFGFGQPSSTERATALVTCGEASAEVEVRYGTGIDLTLPMGTEQCYVVVSGGPEPLERWLSSPIEDRLHPTMSLDISSIAGRNWVEVFDEYPSVYTDIGVFTDQMFDDLLDREPTALEARSWRTELGRGVSPGRLAAGLVTSPEFLGQIAPVTRLYRAYFRRQPDDPGLSYWLDQVRGGMALDEVSWLFGASTEFQRRYGPDLTDAEYIDLVYRNVLGRAPEPEGAAYWAGVLARGTSRAQVMTAFSESAEFTRLTESAIVIRALYYGLLGREPDADGAAYWRSVYEAGGSLEVLVTSFIESDEYENRFWLRDELGDRLPGAVRRSEIDRSPEAVIGGR